jgi:hypothetical protein
MLFNNLIEQIKRDRHTVDGGLTGFICFSIAIIMYLIIGTYMISNLPEYIYNHIIYQILKYFVIIVCVPIGFFTFTHLINSR